MKITHISSAAVLLLTSLGGAANAAQCNAPGTGLTYPVSKKGDQIDLYHGTSVADPYRWLEDGNSADTAAWVTAENQLTQSYLQKIPARDAIRTRLTKLWNYERFSVTTKQGERYFYSRNDGLQNQSVLYSTVGLNGTPVVLLDPNTLSADGTVALASYEVSPDGKLLAYATAASGSDWNEWRVRDVATGKDLADHLQWVKFSNVAWTRDGKGFYYSRYPMPTEATKLAAANYDQKLYFHQVGTAQSSDALVYERPDQKEWRFGTSVTEDGHYLIINIVQSTANVNRVYYKDLTRADAPVLPLLDNFDAAYNFIDNNATTFLFRTDKDAPTGRVIAIGISKPAPANWKEVIPAVTESLKSVDLIGNKLIASYLKDARSQVKVFSLEGKALGEVELPGIGSAAGFHGKRDDLETFYSYTSFTTPSRIYRYDIASGKSSLYREPKVDFDPSAYETRQIFFASKDGTKIPMFIVAKKGIKLDGSNPAILYGYGGFNISLTPSFSVTNLAWMEMGGVYAVPNLRGGGEYGETWHKAGTKLQKQNVFDDFIGAAEWLIKNGYTSTGKLAISGGSNGGLLVGAAMTQRPELFGAALPAVGVMDMLRYHKFTIGWAWASDYGSSDKADEFKALFAYSPLHNLKAGTCYPATMITTADHDDRVVPAHSFKFAATAQAAQTGAAPMLIRIETKAGHGAGKPTSKQIDEATDKLGFLTRELHMPAAPAM
jgi:prolyl oligopeptidase